MAKVSPLAHARLLRPLLQLKIQLTGIEPPIWRRVVVPATIALDKLHQVIQATMDWTDSHLHEFEIADCRYGIPDPDWDDSTLSDKRVTLANALADKKTFRYVYDFGDDWEHRIKVEKVLPPDDSLRHPVCVDGANACPPEDVGGIYGYAHFLEALADPDHPEHPEMLEWYGDEFDPTAFDLARVNQRLQRIKL